MSPKVFILSVLAILVCNIPGMLSDQEGFKYVGCFRDKRQRSLERFLGRVVKVSDCLNKCKQLEVKYAGLQVSGECFCGNKHNKYGKASNCNMKCKSGEKCGGAWANRVFEIPEAPLKIELVGCFKIMNMGQWAGLIVSIEHCLKKCQRYGLPYAGVAYGDYCSCGKDYSKYTKSSSCTKKCHSKEENCGGMSISSVYKVPKLPGYYIQKGFIGCYKEDIKNKVMSVDAGTKRSVILCTDTCRLKKMKYAGLRDGKHCHCGNKYNTHGKATDCTKKCETGEPCGGSTSYSVYEVLEPAQRSDRIGCFKEDNPRKLSKFVTKISFIRQCFEKCINYKYFGIENGEDCYCGNDYPKTVKSDQCTKKCTSGKICGGDKALSVFQILLDL